MSEHTYLAPSSAERWIACPGSAAANAAAAALEGESDNYDAALGTAAHNLLENCVLCGLVPAANSLGSVVYTDPVHGNFVADEEMVDAVQQALDFIEQYLDEHGRDKVRVYTERRVPVGPQIGITPEECSGTSDIMLEHIDGSRLVVMDYKHGKGVQVFAKENAQMLLYAAGAREERGRKFKEYELVIAQPRAIKRHAIDTWIITDAKLHHWLQHKARPSALLALQPNAPRTAGDWCRWCRAAPTCRTYRDKVQAIASTEFEPVADEEDVMSNTQLADLLVQTTMIENWVRSIRAHAMHLLQNGQIIPGWAIGFTTRRREWDDVEGLRSYLRRLKMPIDVIEPRVLLSPAQMQKALKQAGKIPKRKPKSEPARNPLDAFTRLSIPNPKLMQQDAQTEFDPTDEDEDEG